MLERTIIEAVGTAETLIDQGEQGDAQALLTQALLMCALAANDREALAIAKATRLLINLDVGLLPEGAIDAHVERMRRLIAPFHCETTATASAEAELSRFEWVHSSSDADPIVLVDVLRGAREFTARAHDSEHEGVRRAAAEAALTAQIIREWLSQDATSIAVALESLALSLTSESDSRMRHIRIDALYTAARLRIEHTNDAPAAHYLLHTVFKEAGELASARRFYYSATLHLADLSLDAAASPAEALTEATTALHSDYADDVQDAALRCQHLDRMLVRITADDREKMAAMEWVRLINRLTASPDPQVRATVLDHVRFRRTNLDGLTATDLHILQHADTAALRDTHQGTVGARFQVACRIVEVIGRPNLGIVPSHTEPHRDPSLAVRLSEELEQRFPHAASTPELAPTMARMLLERALRLSEIGRREQALSVLAEVRSKVANAPVNHLRHILAQSDYWRGRLQREAGQRHQASTAVDAMVTEFAHDPDPDVRVWAANALHSASRDPELNPSDVDAILDRFAEAFSDDEDPRIRQHDAHRRLNQAVHAHEQGATNRAAQLLKDLVARYNTDTDAEIIDTVRLAQQNLTVLTLSAKEAKTPGTESEEQYRDLSSRLHAADGIYASGLTEEAARQWQVLADSAHGSNDPNIAIIGLAALDMWGAYLNDSQQWVALSAVARRAMVARENLDFRAERMRTCAYLRFGIAQGRVGDPLSAIAAFEALDALAANTGDDEIMTTRQQAIYNRAVMIDDLGDAEGAIEAYEHVLAVHSASRDSQARRLRRIKALRNKALLLNDLNRLPDAASAHRQILDIASGNPDPELCQRARLSAFSLAECFTRLGDHSSSAQTYAWIRSVTTLGFTSTDNLSAARAQKSAERLAHRAGKRKQ